MVLMLLLGTCAQPTAPQTGELIVMIWGGAPDIESQRAAFDRYLSLFPDVTINVIESDCGPAYAACKTLIAGGSI